MFSRTMLRLAVSSALVAGGLSLASAPAQAEPESTDPIKLTLHDWTGQLITTNLMAEILKKAGYNVELVQADYLAQFAGLESGDRVIVNGLQKIFGSGMQVAPRDVAMRDAPAVDGKAVAASQP